MKIYKSRNIILLLLSIAFIYWLYPNGHSISERLLYSSDVNTDKTVVSSVSVLYDVFISIILRSINLLFQIDHLLFAKYISGFFSCINLTLLYAILRQLMVHKTQSGFIMTIVAFSFGIWFLSTVDLPYILATTFSLLGSFFSIKSIRNRHFVFLSGLFAAVAILFHFGQVIWWLGLLIGYLIHYRSLKKTFFFTSPLFIVIALFINLNQYELLKPVTSLNLFVRSIFLPESITSDFHTSSVLEMILSLPNTLLFLKSDLIINIKYNPLYWILILLLVIWIIYSITNFRNTFLKFYTNPFKMVFISHTIIIGLMFIIMIFTMGRSTLLLELPYLLAIIIVTRVAINSRWLLATAILFFIWNFMFCIFPNSQNQLNNKVSQTQLHNTNSNMTFQQIGNATTPNIEVN